MAQSNITGRALLGLLSIRPWTAYDLTQQMRRALRWAWPRSEANLYNEVKKLVPQGLAVAVEEESGGRTRTRYEITEEGRDAVQEWLASTSTPPQLQMEALLRVFLADLGTLEQLQQTVAETRDHLLDLVEQAIPILEDYSSADPPFRERTHLNVLFIHFYAGFVRHALSWCDEVDAEVATWPGTASLGATPGTLRMLEEGLEFYRSALTTRGRTSDS